MFKPTFDMLVQNGALRTRDSGIIIAYTMTNGYVGDSAEYCTLNMNCESRLTHLYLPTHDAFLDVMRSACRQLEARGLAPARRHYNVIAETGFCIRYNKTSCELEPIDNWFFDEDMVETCNHHGVFNWFHHTQLHHLEYIKAAYYSAFLMWWENHTVKLWHPENI